MLNEAWAKMNFGEGFFAQLGRQSLIYDDERISYYQKHIQAIKTAVEHDGVDLMGYLAWSPIDFFK